ncbi:MAG: potassium transporter TrkG [Treponema sp.]|nr:potassium transporter TrkG [Treponema sp.]
MKFRIKIKSSAYNLFTYFIFMAVIGSFLLSLPFCYNGEKIPFIDAIFVTVSAICVTGLSTVDMSVFSNAGFMILLLLIEAGGLGLVSFFTIYLTFASKKLSLVNRNIIKDYFTQEQQFEAKQIVKQIILFTLCIQILGSIFLSIFLYFNGEKKFIFYGIFLSISAFCNAGFSPYSDSLSRFSQNPAIILTLSFIIIFGGLGFNVMSNVYYSLHKSKRRNKQILTLHSKIVLTMTSVLIVLGTVLFYVFERKLAFKDMNFSSAFLNAFFESVTLRTAGFETVSQSAFSSHSSFVAKIFMIIGGSPGSMAGGIKTTTVFLMLLLAYKSANDKNFPSVFKRDISLESIDKATSIFIKAICFLCIMIGLLLWSQKDLILNGIFSSENLVFEAFSAFGTVGLSKGITGLLSSSGKILIMILMFAGRTGITFIAINSFGKEGEIKSLTDYPKEDVLLG